MMKKTQWQGRVRSGILVFMILLVFCGQGVFAGESLSTGTDDSQDQVAIKYARGFTVEYRDGYKLVTVSNAWRGSDTVFTYQLVPRGTTPSKTIPGATIIEIPSERFVALSTTYLSDLEILGGLDNLVGVKGIDLVNSDEIHRRYESGQIQDVAGTGSGMAVDLNMETLIELDPDLIMTYVMGDPKYDSYLKAEEAGMTVVINGESMESSPLGRAEWIKFLAVFLDKEKEATEYFDRMSGEYLDITTKVAESGGDNPTVFTNFDSQGTWYMPGGESYVAQFLKDAGASYLWSDDTSTGSIPLDYEVVYDRVIDADYWVNVGTCNTLDELGSQDSKYETFASFKAGNVYNNNARVNEGGGNDYWQSGVSHPEIVLKDLVKIFHPDLVPDHTLYYYKKLE